ncbi:hypothetical protein PIB30_073956 [Stylosanthes scabra]|uniref:Uncharacterized protein n=1 Tax=Stylosanthes scabra TaxID=79078 RepID=A0ABU6ZND2_9FABA|nr:hypothetical protein [Stylosanthes scabra]
MRGKPTAHIPESRLDKPKRDPDPHKPHSSMHRCRRPTHMHGRHLGSNSGWRNHPHLGWGGSQSPKNNHFQNHPPYQPFHPSPFPQPITLPPPSQPKPPQANFEAALEKLTMTTLEFVQTTTTFIEEARTNFRNQESSIRNLETQVGKIATQLSTHLPNAFPSDTIVNPMVECYAITIGNVEALQESKHEGLNKGNVKGTPTKPPKEEMVINAMQYPEKEDEE